jgi:hypothetical protein
MADLLGKWRKKTMRRGNFALALLLILPVSAVAMEPAIHGHWSGAFHSKHFHIAPFTVDMDIDPDDVPGHKGHKGHKHGHLKNNGPAYCLAGDVNLEIDREGSNVVIAGTNASGDTISFVGTIDTTGNLMMLNYVTNGSVSGKCESDDGTTSLQKK